MGTSSSEHRCCWWCGQRADSKEHRFKASDLRWMFQDSPSLWLDAGERPTRLQGPGAKAVLFPHVLCRDCNSARSQPFDDAYSAFFTYICEGAERFRNLAEFSMEEIYSSDAEGPGNLARYFMKNFACRIASMGFEVPQQVIEFMNGAQGMHNACLLLYRDFALHDHFRQIGDHGIFLYANAMNSPTEPSEGPLIAICAELQVGPIGALFFWDVDTVLGPVFSTDPWVYLRDRLELPYPELHAEQWGRVHE